MSPMRSFPASSLKPVAALLLAGTFATWLADLPAAQDGDVYANLD